MYYQQSTGASDFSLRVKTLRKSTRLATASLGCTETSAVSKRHTFSNIHRPLWLRGFCIITKIPPQSPVLIGQFLRIGNSCSWFSWCSQTCHHFCYTVHVRGNIRSTKITIQNELMAIRGILFTSTNKFPDQATCSQTIEYKMCSFKKIIPHHYSNFLTMYLFNSRRNKRVQNILMTIIIEHNFFPCSTKKLVQVLRIWEE